MSIPKRIITTWICDPGGTPYADRHRDLFYRCLNSWHRVMPDYDIRIVNSTNLFDYGHDDWADRLLRQRNYIGVSQWARLHWLDKLGGVYFDMDVEAVQRLDLLCRMDDMFAGSQSDGTVNNAVIGSPAGHPFLMQQMLYLRTLNTHDPQFGNESGPRMLTKLLKSHGWKKADALATVETGGGGKVVVFPSPVFYPYHWREKFTPDCIVNETVAVHRWASSWDPEHEPCAG